MSGTDQSAVRAPRLRMLANGNVIVGARHVEVVSNNHYAADRADGDIALGADPAFGLKWWGDQTDIQIDVQMALMQPGAGTPAWQSIAVVSVDSIDVDVTTNMLRFAARDLTARFMDTKIQKTYANQTSSQIAQALAAEHNMTADVQATKTLVGQYYQLEHDKITLDNFSHQTTEWDLLTYLAQQEDFDVWVTGTTLHFRPVANPTSAASTVTDAQLKQDAVQLSLDQATGASSAQLKKDATQLALDQALAQKGSGGWQPPFQFVYSDEGQIPSLNATRLRLERSLTLAKDIQVTVKSTNLRNGRAFVRTVRATGSRPASAANSSTQNYVFLKPGLTPDQALQYAQQKLAELTRHERVVTIDMPGELAMTARSMVQISGTGSSWDQVYFIDTLTRIMDWDSGFSQTVRAKNTSPRNQTTVL